MSPCAHAIAIVHIPPTPELLLEMKLIILLMGFCQGRRWEGCAGGFKRLQFKLQTVSGPPSTLGQSKYEETLDAVGFGALGFGGFGGAVWGRLFRRPPRSPSLSCFAPALPP